MVSVLLGWEDAAVRRRVSAIVAALMLSSWSAPASGVPTVTIGNAAGFADSDVDVNVSLSGAAGNVAAVQLDILYPPDVVSIVPDDDCSLAEQLPDSLELFVFHPAPGGRGSWSSTWSIPASC
jgi:hypothetical protein